MVRNIAVPIVFIFLVLFAKSQTTNKNNNAAYLELGGNGLLGSINYERQFLKNAPLNFHIGAGTLGTNSSLTIPFGLRYVLKLKNKNKFFDAGFGLTYTKADVRLYVIYEYRNGDPPVWKFNMLPNIGFRHCFKNNTMLRLSLVSVINQHGVIPYAGIAFGVRF
jgi:hypothetical protein